MAINKVIKDILNKTLVPSKIYKGTTNNLYTIEIEGKDINNMVFITLLYKKEKERNKAFLFLDDTVFAMLSFNPYTYIET